MVNLAVYVLFLALVIKVKYREIVPTPSKGLYIFYFVSQISHVRNVQLIGTRISLEEKFSLISPIIKRHVQGKRIFAVINGIFSLIIYSITEVYRLFYAVIFCFM